MSLAMNQNQGGLPEGFLDEEELEACRQVNEEYLNKITSLDYPMARRKVSDIPFSELKVGMEVLGANNISGKITALIPIQQAYRQEDNDVEIQWDNGNKTCIWHFWCSKITTLVRP